MIITEGNWIRFGVIKQDHIRNSFNQQLTVAIDASYKSLQSTKIWLMSYANESVLVCVCFYKVWPCYMNSAKSYAPFCYGPLPPLHPLFFTSQPKHLISLLGSKLWLSKSWKYFWTDQQSDITTYGAAGRSLKKKYKVYCILTSWPVVVILLYLCYIYYYFQCLLFHVTLFILAALICPDLFLISS